MRHYDPMTRTHEIPTDPYDLRDLIDDSTAAVIDEEPEHIDAPRYELVAERRLPDGSRLRRYSNRPNHNKEKQTMTTNRKSRPMGDDIDGTTSAAGDHIAAIDGFTDDATATSEQMAPRLLLALEQEAWNEAEGVIARYVSPSGFPYTFKTAQQLADDLRKARPSTTPARARIEVQKSLRTLIATKANRLAQISLTADEDTSTATMLVLVECPTGSRLAQQGYEAVAVVWTPSATYTLTDEETGDVVTLPSLYDGVSAGYAHAWADLADASEEFDRLRSAYRTLRKLSTDPRTKEHDDEFTVV